MTGTTLITGADGYLGRRIAAELLNSGDDALLLAVRAADSGELAAKRDLLAAELGPSAAGRTSVVPADLRDDDAFDPVDPEAVTRIVHAAAVTRFNVDRDTARRVNVEGTVRVAEFARRCRNLRRFALLSTLYAAGRRSGIVKEERHDDAGFVNHYEWSKWAAEEHVLDACADLPLSVLRLPTVIADDDGGRVTQYNAYHNTLKLYYYGLLSLVPGDEGTPLHFATAHFTTAAVIRLLDPAAPEGIYHVCPDPSHNATLGRLIDTIFEVYERDERFRRRRLLRPVYCTRASFDDLVEVAEHLKGGPIHESLGSVSPFAHQLYLPKEFRNDALRSVWEGYAAPDPVDLFQATSEYLVASRWGREEGVPR
ncbi:SDR family oxidoreductase [Thermomonospora amylolytica]|uniref:SDR family oxidoreductase n=1 Tax=Thermomonospora amylolytica TaxID=1411117 RepID=UPI001300B6AF|nr:SDR family oxidoreductase [Thermomonospora amylolytica]